MSTGRVMLSGAALGAAAWAWFTARPDMPVRVGRRETHWCAPPRYQASAFPAFGAVIAQGAEDLLVRGDERRLLLAGISSAVGLLRLQGWLPWSGHAFFLGAVVAFESVASARNSVALSYALGGLAITLPYKARWNDLSGALSSLVLGGWLGGWLGARYRYV